MKGIFGIRAKIGKWTALILSLLLFSISLVAYGITAHVRHQENPRDKVVPTFSQLWNGFHSTAFEKDRRNDEYRLWVDTWASAKRFGLSAILLSLAVLLGLYMGVFPLAEHLFLKFMTFFDKIPALALLPILFIFFGLGEVSKVALILIGVFPTITLDTYLRARDIPREQFIKAFTLGASDSEVAFRVVLPQIIPEVLNTIRLNFKAMVLFLIAGESLAATVGLGYRIFVVRRYIAMDIIIPYVIWMSLLAFVADGCLRWWIQHRYHWQEGR